MRNAGQSLNAGIMQPIILDFITARAPELLGNFKVSILWIPFPCSVYLDYFEGF